MKQGLRFLILSLFAGSPPARALVIFDTHLGLGLSSSMKIGGQFPASVQSYGFGASYVGEMPRALLSLGKERFTLGLALQAGTVSYRTLNIENQGAHVGFNFRPGYSVWIGEKWIIEASLPFFLYSRVSAAGFSEHRNGQSTIQSASLSDLNGSGGLGLSVRGLRRLGIKVAKTELVVGAALEYQQQNLQRKVDDVLSTAPDSSGVTNLEHVQTGSFQLSSWMLLFSAGSVL